MASSVDHAGAQPPPLKAAPRSEGEEVQTETRRTSAGNDFSAEELAEQRRIRLRVDFRLCSIAGILCSLNLLDSGVISNAAVTSMLSDLELNQGNRYSVSIFIFTIASIAFQLPSTIAVRTFGPRIWFSLITFAFGTITFCTAFVTSWKQMIALRILLGIAMSGIYPGLTYLISTYYTRREQQVRFALLQTGEVVVLATGGIVNYGLNTLDGQTLKGWQWMFLVQGLITCCLGLVTYFWMVDFPEHAHKSFRFLDKRESEIMAERINHDRGDAAVDKFAWSKVLIHASDPKIWGFCCMFFLLNMVSTSLSYFLPTILHNGLGYSSSKSILLNAPVYYYAAVPALTSSYVGDKFALRGPVITFNSAVLIIGYCMLGFVSDPSTRYAGTFLATGAYVANWAALNAYMANNITGQWKRVFAAAATSAFNGAGGIAGAYIIRYNEAPKYPTAIWASIG
jgi:MFS family permease